VTNKTVTFIFPDVLPTGRTGKLKLPWVKGKLLHQYLKEPGLKPQALLARCKSHKLFNSKRQQVHLAYTPTPDDLVVFIKADK
jgi:hypothetical protein